MIEVDEHCHTGVDGVWAVGDCVRGPMLAHKGFEEGIAVAELIAGLPGHVNLDTIPWVIYTEPEIAWVGKTEEAAQGRRHRRTRRAASRSPRWAAPWRWTNRRASSRSSRTRKPIASSACTWSASTSPSSCTKACVAMEFNGSADDLARICHAHPTLSEAVHDAAMAVHKRAIHKAN